MDRLLMIPITALKSKLERDYPDFAEKAIEERAKLAMKHAHDEGVCFMTPSDDQKFRAACGALLLMSSEEEQGRITVELRMLQGLSAATQGLPIDFGALIPDGFSAIGLMGIYNESKPVSPW